MQEEFWLSNEIFINTKKLEIQNGILENSFA